MIAASSLGRLWAGQLPGRLHAIQTAGGQRGDRRSAQFPAGNLGHRRHARRSWRFLRCWGALWLGVRGQGAGGREGLEAVRVGGEPPTPRSQSPSSNPQSSILNPQSTISNLQFQISDPASDGWLHVLAAACSGSSCRCRWECSARRRPSLMAVAIGLPLAAATVALMFGWIRDGRLPRWLPGACAASMLVALLAAGGIAMPGIAATFWLLLALGLEGRRLHFLPVSAAWAALAGLFTLAIACYGTAYEPVLHCQAELRLAERQPARAVKHLEAAAAADPLSAEPWRQLAAVEFEAWARQPDKARLRPFRPGPKEGAGTGPQCSRPVDGRGRLGIPGVFDKKPTRRTGALAVPFSRRSWPTAEPCNFIQIAHCVMRNWRRHTWPPATGRPFVARRKLPCGWTALPPIKTRSFLPSCAIGCAANCRVGRA